MLLRRSTDIYPKELTRGMRGFFNSLLAEESDSFAAAQVRAPGTLADYYRLREMLEHLILKVADDESHPMAALVDRVGTLVEQYESTHLPEILESKQKR